VLVGLLALYGVTRNRVIAFAVAWPVAAAVSQSTDNPLLTHVLNGSNSTFFAAGMVMYLMYREGQSLFLWMVLAMQWAIAMHTAGTNLTASLLRNTGHAFAPWVLMVAVTVCFALVLLATLSPVARFSLGWITFCGSLTYPLYLVHEHWGWVTISLLHESIGQVPALLVTIVLVLLAAAAINVWIERPLAPKLRDAVRRGLTTDGPAPVVASRAA
jgi:peptidoglycan/LPS O-acetylase OafA/YrhL